MLLLAIMVVVMPKTCVLAARGQMVRLTRQLDDVVAAKDQVEALITASRGRCRSSGRGQQRHVTAMQRQAGFKSEWSETRPRSLLFFSFSIFSVFSRF